MLESCEPEKKSFYDLDFRALDQDLSPEQRQEWNTIYASFRSRSVMRGTIIGVDPHSMTVRSAQTGQVETKRMYCAVIVPFRARILIPETEMWAESEERPAFVLRNMPGAQIDFVITHVDREAGFAIGSRRLALASRRYFFSTQPLHQPGSRVPCHVLAVGPRRCLVECYGYDVNLSQRDMSYAAIPDLREQYHPGDELTCVVKQFDRKAGSLEISVKETRSEPLRRSQPAPPRRLPPQGNHRGKIRRRRVLQPPRRRGRHVPVLVPLRGLGLQNRRYRHGRDPAV